MPATWTQRWLDRLGLHRPELRAWALYDCANSVFMTTVILIFPVFFYDVAAAGRMTSAQAVARFGWATTVSMALVALLSPVLGAIADYGAMKKKMLAVTVVLGAGATGAMYWIGPGDWVLALVLVMAGRVGVMASLVFYESLLPDIASQEEIDRVSTAGYAIGYLGSGLLMALNLAWMARPELFGIPSQLMAVRLTFATSALWWLGFSVPLFLRVPEPPRRLGSGEAAGANLVGAAFHRLRQTLGEIRGYRHAFLFLIAFLIYNDGIGTIINMATIYGAQLGLDRGVLLMSVLAVQFVGIPCTFAFGSLAGRIGAKHSIYVSLLVYLGVSVYAYGVDTATDFFILCLAVGTVQGGAQALSRSLFATMIPRHKSSEFFAFFSVFEKFAGIFGPALFAAMTTASGSSRNAILSLVVFFLVGGALLAFVDVEAGQRAAREAEARAGVSAA
jgi:UMF1 family MFS transporter